MHALPTQPKCQRVRGVLLQDAILLTFGALILAAAASSALLIVPVFIALTVTAFYYLHIQQSAVGLGPVFDLHCPAHGDGIGIAAYRSYTGRHGVDQTLCIIVNVFDTVFRPPNRLVNVPIFLSLPAAWLTTTLEAASLFPENRLLAIGFPALLGTAAQLVGGAVALPVYWLICLLLRAKTRAEGRPVARPDDCAMAGVILGILIGVAPITIAMVVWPTQLLITLWQPMPLYLAAIQLAVIPFFAKKPSKQVTKDSVQSPNSLIYCTTLLSYAILALLVTPGYIPFLRAVLSSPNRTEMLADAFLPYPFVYTYPSTQALIEYSPANEAKQFIQWDVIFIFVTVWLAGVWWWALSSVRNFLLALSTAILGGVTLGPGAFISVPYMIQTWRDEQLRVHASASSVAKKAQ